MTKSEDRKARIIALRKSGMPTPQIAAELGLKDDRYIRKNLAKWGITAPTNGSDKQLADPTQALDHDKLQTIKRFVVTSALNNTDIHQGFLSSIRTYCGAKSAQLVVIPVHYKNVSLYSGPYESWWPTELEPYFLTKDLHLNSNITIMGKIRIQATASRPLQGLAGITKGKSAVFGHPRIAVDMIATPLSKLPNVYMTTGSISLPAYSETKLGALGEFHHTIGAVIIETDGEYFWWRHIQANLDNDGSFSDLDGMVYYPDRVEKAPPALAVVMGDIHVGFEDKAVISSVQRLLTTTQCQNLLLHDVFDGFSLSHHHENQPLLQWAKANGESYNRSVQDELRDVCSFLYSMEKLVDNIHIISSNHHDHLTKWLNLPSSKINPRDLGSWFHLNNLRLKYHDKQRPWDLGNPLELYWDDVVVHEFYKKDFPNFIRVSFPSPNEPLEFAGIDCGQHGHIGPNGSRGSARGFAATQRKTIVAHTHTPRWVDGCLQVGMSCTKELVYLQGYSTHLAASAIIYADGSRALFPIINGKSHMEDSYEA